MPLPRLSREEWHKQQENTFPKAPRYVGVNIIVWILKWNCYFEVNLFAWFLRRRQVFRESGNSGQQNPQHCRDGLVVYVCSEVGDHEKRPDRSLLHLQEVVFLLPPQRGASSESRETGGTVCCWGSAGRPARPPHRKWCRGLSRAPLASPPDWRSRVSVGWHLLLDIICREKITHGSSQRDCQRSDMLLPGSSRARGSTDQLLLWSWVCAESGFPVSK